MRDWTYTPPRDRDLGGERLNTLGVAEWESQLRQCVAEGIPFIHWPSGWYGKHSTKAQRIQVVNDSIRQHQRVLRYWLERKGSQIQTRAVELDAAAD